ncbi:hypothetical protein Zmor_015281 [Zophobas morio]|uniref:Tyr recombinase domain-containing protein n=1 Tax=Zophobas morio TaxID=2755281 RepID=A0AA38IHQ8_9CUCU|nr:hypothetical protein Zmor_015281 [Zophobas morio]
MVVLFPTEEMLSVKENIDISRFYQVSAFLKQQSVGHRPKKSKMFIQKVIFIVGVFGGCRIGEQVTMSVDDIEGVAYLRSKFRTRRLINPKHLPPSVEVTLFLLLTFFGSTEYYDLKRFHTKRLFINFKNKKCTVRPVRVNVSTILRKIAQFLGSQYPKEYTGPSFRRSSAALLADLTVLKRHGGWRSNRVLEEYIENSLNNKIEISRRIIKQLSTIINNRSALNP